MYIFYQRKTIKTSFNKYYCTNLLTLNEFYVKPLNVGRSMSVTMACVPNGSSDNVDNRNYITNYHGRKMRPNLLLKIQVESVSFTYTIHYIFRLNT